MDTDPARQPIKSGYFSFEQIEKYFLKAKNGAAFQTVSDRTFRDLDLEDVFRLIDRTVSCVGQQLLYHTLRTIPKDETRSTAQERLISLFQQNPAVRAAVKNQIARLSKRDAYYIQALFQEPYLERPRWFRAIQALSAISIISVVSAFFFPQFIIFLMLLLPVNLGVHYWNKNNLHRYGSSIPQLLLLNKIAGTLLNIPELAALHADLRKSVNVLDRLGPAMSVFKIEARLQSEVGQLVEYVVELIKALFLIEPVLLFSTLRTLDKKRGHISAVFHFVGETDVALSVLNLRESMPHYCLPAIHPDHSLTIKEVYHPLLFDGVANSIDLREKSALLTGSNMSGKTTFIRTVGINAILAQTIHTCFAGAFSMPRLKVHSAIRISDDLLSDKSYYFEEVLALKEMLDESQSADCHLFLLDELFKGTNSVERISIGKSVLEFMAQRNNLVLVSTHDAELADLLADHFDLYHFTEIVNQNDIIFDYKLKPGRLVTTNAIRILELNQYPQEVIDEARKTALQMKAK